MRERFIRTIAGLCLLAFSASALAVDWAYTVRPGDDLWRLAAKYCGSAAFVERLAKHNGLARPEDLQAGTRLQIPVDWLVRQPAEVEVKSVSGEVTDENGKPYAAGDRIVMGDRMLTLNGFAVVVFADGSSLAIGKQSEVLFNVLTSFGDSGMVDTHLRFYKGRGAAKIIKDRVNTNFRIWTPSGIAAVRGTDFRVGVVVASAAVAAASRVETVTGAVEFDDKKKQVSLPAGFGLIASSAGSAKEALLPAPVIEQMQKPIWQVGQVVRWQGHSQAQEYRVNLYRQEKKSLRPIRSVAQQHTEFELNDLDAGEYAFAVRAVAQSGLEGFDTHFAMLVGAGAPVARDELDFELDDSLRWEAPDASNDAAYEVQIANNVAFTNAVSYTVNAERVPLAETMAARPGIYFWRVRQTNSDFSQVRQIVVHPDPVENLEVHREAWQDSTNGQVLALNWLARPQEHYAVTVKSVNRNSNEAPVYSSDAISGGAHQTAPLPAGSYRVELVARAGGVDSQAKAAEVVVVEPKPWWAPVLLVAPFLFVL